MKDFSDFGPGLGILIVFLIAVWALSIYLKAKGLWRASRNGQKGWFIAMFILNTMGILPAIYLLTNPEKKK